MKRTPFSVSNGRNHGNSLAAQRAAELALANGTSEGALKGWETRRGNGGGGLLPKDTVASVRASIAANDPKEFPEQRKRLEEYGKWAESPEANKKYAARNDPSMDGHPAQSAWTKRVEKLEGQGLDRSDAQGVADVEWKQHGRFLANKLAAATKPADALSNGEFVLFKKGQNSPDDIAADESKDKEEDAKDAGIDEEKEGEGANKKMANGEFVLFKKGQNSLGDIKDDAKKEPEGKDGKGPDDDNDEDDKKAWVPPWKKDGVKNAAEPVSESDALAAKLTAATLSNAGNSEGAKKGWEGRRSGVPTAEQSAAYSKSARDSSAKAWTSGKLEDHEAAMKAHEAAILQGQGDYGSKDADRHSNEYYRHEDAANKLYGKMKNSGNSEGAHEGWLTRRGGVRAGDTFDHESGSGKHVKLTIQGQLDGQKNIELDLPKDVHTAIAAGSWKPNADFEKNSRGEDFHTIHGYEPVTKPGGIREKYGKGSEPDKANGLIGQNVSRAKAYYARARDFGDGTEAQNALKAKAESILKDIHSKHHPALVKAKAAHASSLGNRAYGALLNSFRGGLLKNYHHDVQEMLDEVADYASNGETLPDDLREQYEEWMDEQN